MCCLILFGNIIMLPNKINELCLLKLLSDFWSQPYQYFIVTLYKKINKLKRYVLLVSIRQFKFILFPLHLSRGFIIVYKNSFDILKII